MTRAGSRQTKSPFAFSDPKPAPIRVPPLAPTAVAFLLKPRSSAHTFDGASPPPRRVARARAAVAERENHVLILPDLSSAPDVDSSTTPISVRGTANLQNLSAICRSFWLWQQQPATRQTGRRLQVPVPDPTPGYRRGLPLPNRWRPRRRRQSAPA